MIRKPQRLRKVHPHLRKVIKEAAPLLPFDIQILEGARTRNRQKQYVKRGSSRTMNSRHLIREQDEWWLWMSRLCWTQTATGTKRLAGTGRTTTSSRTW